MRLSNVLSGLFALCLASLTLWAPLGHRVLAEEGNPATGPQDMSEISLQASTTTSVERPSTLQAPVTDPNFNTMRNKDVNKSLAVKWVVGVLSIATVVPVATWWFFSR